MTWTGDSIPFADASAIVSAQHESYDGTGFPRGLKGVTGRPASGTISIPAAKEEILRASGTRFDPKILLGVGTLDLFDDCMVRCCRFWEMY
jgi:HD-GYP domain-containing protein (c-di-GMP phosphodiesterase class II)